MADKPQISIIRFVLVFTLVYIGSQFFLRTFFPEQFTPNQEASSGVTITMEDSTLRYGNDPVVKVQNTTGEDLVLTSRCPQPPFIVSNQGSELQVADDIQLHDDVPCQDDIVVAAGKTTNVSLAPWKYALFSESEQYSVRLTDDANVSTSFTVEEPGIFVQLFRTFVTKPLLNALIFIASVLPGHSLGWSIIILTVIVKMILFIPTQHALEGQQKLQLVQPKIDALREKYKNDPQKLNQETMKLWKQEKVNPFQSCLPMLLQFPVLIGLFFVIRDSSVLSSSQHLIYSFYQHLNWSFDTQFLGFNLLKPSVLVFPPLLAISQHLQMRLTFAIAEKKKVKKEKVIEVGADKKVKKSDTQNAQAMQQKIMMYGLPLMIAVFAFRFPTAVSLYWFVSTVFAVGQQLVVNRKHL